jgi:hypothetical protein
MDGNPGVPVVEAAFAVGGGTAPTVSTVTVAVAAPTVAIRFAA